jgi:hypothetical protein
MAALSLTNSSAVALVDDEDFERARGYHWNLSKGYVRTCVKRGEKWVTVRLHGLVMNAKKGEEIDHKNPNNKLDCRKSNLRRANRKIQVANQRVRSSPGKTSKFKGVYLKRNGRWGAQLQTTINGLRRKKHLGYFSDEEQAAKAYNNAAISYFGEFALLNPV